MVRGGVPCGGSAGRGSAVSETASMQALANQVNQRVPRRRSAPADGTGAVRARPSVPPAFRSGPGGVVVAAGLGGEQGARQRLGQHTPHFFWTEPWGAMV